MSSNNQQGYIALVSAIVISVLLIAVTFTLSFTGFFARFNVLASEYKERSIALADACGDTVIANFAEDYFYNPNNASVTIDSNSCTIVSLQNNVPSTGQATAYTNAIFNGARTNLKIVFTSANLSVVSWEELATYP